MVERTKMKDEDKKNEIKLYISKFYWIKSTKKRKETKKNLEYRK